MAEIVYHINPIESCKQQLLIIELGEIKQGALVKNNSGFPYSFLLENKTSQEKEALEFLIQRESEFQREKTGKALTIRTSIFHHIHIPYKHSLEAIKLLNSTQKLYFNDRRLVIDLFGKVEYYYLVQTLPDNKLSIQGRLKWNDKDISLHESEFICGGTSPWFIKGISLKLISTQIKWKDLMEYKKSSSLILDSFQKAMFLENYQTDGPLSPRIVLQEAEIGDITKPIEPFPLLILKDRTGAFADLWMSYGTDLFLLKP